MKQSEMRSHFAETLAAYVECLANDDKEGAKQTLEYAETHNVNMADAIIVNMNSMYDIMDYCDMSQAVQETRMKDIVSCLPEETQEKIKNKFRESEDSLLEESEEQ
jgi:hypothetical protein